MEWFVLNVISRRLQGKELLRQTIEVTFILNGISAKDVMRYISMSNINLKIGKRAKDKVVFSKAYETYFRPNETKRE